MKGCYVLFAAVLFSMTGFAGSSYGGFTFIPNDMMTTPFGPAYADILLEPENFLPCEGGPYALCYYSGPEPISCETTEDGKFANCKCFELPYGKYFVDINAIQNVDIYLETVAACGDDGSGCQATNSAPVCGYINTGTFFPDTDMVSTFSFACVPEQGIGETSCPQSLYAGCMTAPCTRTEEDGIVDCLCPAYDGPYQVGLNDQACTLGDNLIWSAAYNPNVTGTIPVPPAGGCIPDAPESLGGCPLITSNIPEPPPGIDCAEVCSEYESCLGPNGVQAGFSCDATLCTDQCNDGDLVGDACAGLSGCDISEIAKLEAEVGCSCCASQICGCEASAQTENAMFGLNQRQRDIGITPQCDINGTLCGEERRGGGGSSCAVSGPGDNADFSIYLIIISGLVMAAMLRKRFKVKTGRS